MASVLWPFAGCAGVGVFIDFVLGPVGQRRVKDWLEIRWYKFHEVSWHNFSEKEAQYFVALQDRVFGSRFFSLRRLVSTVCALLFFYVLFTILTRIIIGPINGADILDESGINHSTSLAIAAAVFAVSLSLTRWISTRVIHLSTTLRVGPWLYFALIVVHYALLVVWRPVVESFNTDVSEVAGLLRGGAKLVDVFHWSLQVPQALLENLGFHIAHPAFWNPRVVWHGLLTDFRVGIHNGMPRGPLYAMSYFANIFRILAALALLISFVFREWIGRLFSLLWDRVVTSTQGAFTLILGGIGALAAALGAILQHL